MKKTENMRSDRKAVNLRRLSWVDSGRLVGWWLPAACLLCDARLGDRRGLCAACAASLSRLGPACRRCALPLPAPGLCGACLRLHGPDESWSPLRYAPPVDGLLQALKFQGRLEVAAWLGGFMAEVFTRSGRDRPGLLVPVPLHRGRLARRGFNQALELCRPLARALAIPLDGRCCERLRPTPSQSGLDHAGRRRNVRNAFAVHRPPPVDHVAIVDDILTTGATTRALAQALHRAGVHRVDVWTAARVV